MAKGDSTLNSSEPPSERKRAPLPAGYRRGIIAAITVVLSFSLLFERWNLQLAGAWTLSSALAAILMALAIVLELVTLWRALQLKDDDETEYGKTLRWFLWSGAVLLTSFAVSAWSISHLNNSGATSRRTEQRLESANGRRQ